MIPVKPVIDHGQSRGGPARPGMRSVTARPLSTFYSLLSSIVPFTLKGN